ncbi:GrlR family regulatory protein [Rhodopseudomonas pseudopalustris]|uniref:T3SS negative regulator,GrlR n=1 Tax=Rhodopseudomonas pseudopalustris TaxID=1513892 RepID=A0A1H8X9P5_9BRAD|nr:GrlR family regulatory protein [Rhodopseudomonas pseudopalustris]SEP36581.1 T3SS negative regulator,GrlR [Rhodopseudomonas pseudopalustris]
MRNGLYSIHIRMLDGVRAWANGVIILRDGKLLGGDPYFWSVGDYTVGDGNWKGDLLTRQHTPYAETPTRPVFAGREVSTGFSGTFADDRSEVFGTSLVGSRSVSFRATLHWLADDA